MEDSSATASPLRWSDSKVALVELIYALNAAGSINNGKSELKQIVQLFEKMFAIELGNYARVFAEIRTRKSGTSNFINHLKDRIERLNYSGE